MIESAKMTVNFDGDTAEIVHSGLAAHEAWQIGARAISELINEGEHDRSGTLDAVAKAEIFAGDYIATQYSFAMPTSFFREQFGQRPGFLSSVFGDFETLLITPRHGYVGFYFISEQSDMFHAFTLNSWHVYSEFLDYFAHGPGLLWAHDFEIRSESPIGEQLLHANVREFVLFFFPNPAVASEGVTINGVYTYMDNARVVKFYPNNMVEYNALAAVQPQGTVSLASSLLAALDMLAADRVSMLTNGTGMPMNDTFLVGYSEGPAEGQWNFYFDYYLSGKFIDIYDIGTLNHAVEIRVINNSVVQYRRLMLNFYIYEVD